MDGRLEIRRLGPDNADDFRALLGAPPEGWCWCVAWETPDWEAWPGRSAEENRALREELWSRGEYHGYLLYRDDEPAGWCRVGPRAAWPKLCTQFGLDARQPVHAFTCFGLRPEWRGRGLMHEFLSRVVKELQRRGVREVEAFPKAESGRLACGEVWNGPRRLFESAGFQPKEVTGPRVHMVRELP